MNAALLLSFFNVRAKELQTPPAFTSSQSWTAPSTTTSLATLVGKGTDGTPARDRVWGYTTFSTVTVRDRDNNITSGPTRSYVSTTFYLSPPAPYCSGVQSSSGTTETCYSYETFDYPAAAATNGQATTAFGKTFAGGVGGPANAVTYTNVAVTPLASYNLVIPAGGSITITYYK